MSRITTYDIAQACGFSQATVDRALNNRSNIKKETRELILKTAAEMNYRPSNVPLYFHTEKSRMIGVIVPQSLPFYSDFLAALAKAVSMRGYHMLVAYSDFNIKQEKYCLAEFLKTNVDGVIIFPISEDGSEIKKIILAGVPVVTLVRKVRNYNFDYISINYYEAAERATNYLISLGHKKIGYYTIWDNSSNLYTYNKRLDGIKTALKKNHLQLEEKHVLLDTENHQTVQHLIFSNDLPSAFICFNDLNAIGLASYLNSAGLKIPDNISIISFDNISLLKYFNPGITSISYPYDEMSEATIDLLISRIGSAKLEGEQILFEAQMMRRNSCMRIAKEL